MSGRPRASNHMPLQDKENQICQAPSTNGSFSAKKKKKNSLHLDQIRRFNIKTPL